MWATYSSNVAFFKEIAYSEIAATAAWILTGRSRLSNRCAP
jgi:hypothetical protein